MKDILILLLGVGLLAFMLYSLWLNISWIIQGFRLRKEHGGFFKAYVHVLQEWSRAKKEKQIKAKLRRAGQKEQKRVQAQKDERFSPKPKGLTDYEERKKNQPSLSDEDQTLFDEAGMLSDMVGKTITIEYTDANDKYTERKVIVDKVDGIYLKGFCLLRNEDRTFRIDRIDWWE